MVKNKINWSVDAKADLINILEFYIKRNGSSAFSIKLNKKINKSIKLLSKNPFLGTPTDFHFIRVLITDDYQIIYEIFDKLILIIMIWDCLRDPASRKIGKRIK